MHAGAITTGTSSLSRVSLLQPLAPLSLPLMLRVDLCTNLSLAIDLPLHRRLSLRHMSALSMTQTLTLTPLHLPSSRDLSYHLTLTLTL